MTRTPPPALSDADLVELHSLRNDGCSLSYIKGNKFEGLSLATIRRVLSEPLPEHLRDDPRCAPERWIWVSVEESYPGTEKDKAWPLVILRYPLPITQKAFGRTFRALVRAVRDGAGLTVPGYAAYEALEGRADAERLIVKGVMAWEADREGVVTRLVRSEPVPG